MSYSAPNSIENLFKFQNKEKIKELGLTNFGARLYDQNSGLFKQVDPYVENHYEISGYNFVLNNPLRYIDPFGLDTLSSKDKDFSWSNVKTGDVLNGSNVLPDVVVKSTKTSSSNFEIPLFGEWKITRLYGNYILQSPWVRENAAITPGPFVIASSRLNPLRIKSDKKLILHEIGHIETLKLLNNNILAYYSLIALPSVMNYVLDTENKHMYFYTEKIANTLSKLKFGNEFNDEENYPTYLKK